MGGREERTRKGGREGEREGKKEKESCHWVMILLFILYHTLYNCTLT
jgi:hypothetical protein